MIQAVIFDMDGVLIDSEIVYLKHQYEALHKKYPWVTLESLYPLVGMSGTEDKPFLAGLLRRDAGDPAFLAEIDALYRSCTVHYPDILRPQVPALLKTLRAMGLQVALASSSSTQNIHQVLSECGIEALFDYTISGDQFHRSKPDPEIYQCTMRRLGRRPEECLIVEDSTYGVAAGVAAGATVAALRDDRFPFDQSPAQLHIESLDEVPALAACGGRRIRAAFFDVDGTLAAMGSHYLPDSARRAITRLRENGVAAIVSTGRHALELEEENILPGLDFDGYIYMNGQLCELAGRPVLENRIAPAELRALRVFLQQHHRSCIILERDAMYTNLVDDRLVTEQARIGTAVPPVRDIDGLEDRAVYQVIPFVSPGEEAELMARMPGCKAMRWGEAVVDVATVSGGKEAGIRALCAALGITTEEIIAFGDGQNDIGMLQLAGIGVAMGNALDEVKAAADYVTDTVEADGLAHALQHFHLI